AQDIAALGISAEPVVGTGRKEIGLLEVTKNRAGGSKPRSQKRTGNDQPDQRDPELKEQVAAKAVAHGGRHGADTASSNARESRVPARCSANRLAPSSTRWMGSP